MSASTENIPGLKYSILLENSIPMHFPDFKTLRFIFYHNKARIGSESRNERRPFSTEFDRFFRRCYPFIKSLSINKGMESRRDNFLQDKAEEEGILAVFRRTTTRYCKKLTSGFAVFILWIGSKPMINHCGEVHDS
jgi:hypothetical protein